jgi:nucleoside recognition membrane protein YjiH
MLESEIPVTILDLIIIFLERTIIAIPLVAIAAHLLF